MQRIPKAINKKRLVRYKEGAEMYSMGMNKFQTLAKDAGAILKIDRMVLVDLDVLTSRNFTTQSRVAGVHICMCTSSLIILHLYLFYVNNTIFCEMKGCENFHIPFLYMGVKKGCKLQRENLLT